MLKVNGLKVGSFLLWYEFGSAWLNEEIHVAVCLTFQKSIYLKNGLVVDDSRTVEPAQ
jgi:hypothetical protein